jgi:hypothetical protein
MRPTRHAILATCILTSFWPATGECEPESLWNHNGSVMALHAVGAEHVISYQEPRMGMRQEGVVSGTVRFKGTKSENTYSGTAFVFSRRCGAHPYQVTGTISADERQIAISGTAPAGFDAACRPVVYRKEVAHFSFLRSIEPSPPVDRDRGAADAAAAERARVEAARAAQEREEQRLRSLREQQEREAMDLREQQERAERVRRDREQEARRTEEVRTFSNQRDGCRKYNAEACDIALNSPHASRQDVAAMRNWRDVAKKLRADFDGCRTGSVAACDRALASPAVAEEHRPLLNEWRSAASPLNRAMAHAGTVARTAIDGLNVIRSLPTFAQVTGGLAAVLALALALAAMAWRRRHPSSSARPQAAAPPSAARDTPAAIEALELAHAYVDEVREADTPALEDHELRNHHLDLLALASKQFDAAQKRDPNAVLEGQDKSGIAYRFSIDELRADALLLEGITHHTYDLKRAIPALREATTLNPNRAYAFYVLGLTYAANMDKSGAVAALRRAVALNPQNLSYRKELNRAQSLSAREIATHKATRFGKWILDSSTMAWNSFAASWNIVRVPRLLFQAIYRGVFRL